MKRLQSIGFPESFCYQRNLMSEKHSIAEVLAIEALITKTLIAELASALTRIECELLQYG